jgi:hypothetical protein
MLARTDDDSALSDAARWGLDVAPEDLAPLTADDAVWESNVDAVMAFLSISTQWRVVAGATGLIYTGLDYAGVRDGLSLAGIVVTPDLWAGVQTIERGALSAMAEDRR